MRNLARVLLALAAVLGAVLAGVVAFVQSARPVVDGRRFVPGVSAPVEVWRDSMDVPHIWARSETDALFAQGYVHAQERLWQMELFRRVAQGRLAEVMGADLLESDRFLRTVGLWRAAAAEAAMLDPAARRTVQAYADGVNAFLRDRPGALPPELLVLRIRPEPWSVASVLAIEKVMAWDLAEYQASAAVWAAARRLPPDRARLVLPEYPSFGPTVLEATPPPPVPAAAAALVEAASIVRASNSWVVAGTYTRSGKPILANDMHLALRAPGIWMLQALHAPGLDVVGMTLPGVPYVIAGHNEAVAWGFTNAMVDDADLFLERVDATAGTYEVPGGASAPLSVVQETLRVRGRDRPEVMQVRLTRHGPLLPAPRGGSGAEEVALRWASHEPSHSLAAIAALDRAGDWNGFLRAAALFDDPHQNLVYADTAGHIGYAMAGRVPLRGSPEPGSAKPPPMLPVPGWTGDWDWKGWLPFTLHPQVLDPADGYVVTANNRQDTSAVSRLITADWAPPWRAARIREMIRGGGALAPTRSPVGGWVQQERATAGAQVAATRPAGGLAQPERAPARAYDAAAVHAMQMDLHDSRAERYLGRAVEAAEAAGLNADADELRRWDTAANASSHAAALFQVWLVALRRAEATSLYAGEPGYFPGDLEDRTLEEGRLPWNADGRAYQRLAVAAMRQADVVARGKVWGDLNRLVIEHPLGSVRPLQALLHLTIGPLPRGGSPATVNVSDFSGRAFPVTTSYGPSERHVVDMGDVDGAGGFILPAGQSGLPFDPHYRDMLDAWRGGRLWRIPLGRAAARARTVHALVLEPRPRR